MQTSHSLFSRLAIIALVHEARGLDSNPMQIRRCRAAGDEETARVLEVIHADEITHVAAGAPFCPCHFQVLFRPLLQTAPLSASARSLTVSIRQIVQATAISPPSAHPSNPNQSTPSRSSDSKFLATSGVTSAVRSILRIGTELGSGAIGTRTWEGEGRSRKRRWEEFERIERDGQEGGEASWRYSRAGPSFCARRAVLERDRVVVAIYHLLHLFGVELRLPANGSVCD